ncbi:MAG: hypothetical protein E5299_00692 [Burkholderia gladioli]|nr:MAG: hypothetical protein E5299_00692 [Burkholderia gladioli]
MKIVTPLKSIMARGICVRSPHVKRTLWGDELRTDGYFASTVGKHGDEEMTGRYVRE